MADENKNIIVHYNKSKKEAFELCKELNKNKKNIFMPIPADLNQPKQVKDIFNTLKKNLLLLIVLLTMHLLLITII